MREAASGVTIHRFVGDVQSLAVGEPIQLSPGPGPAEAAPLRLIVSQIRTQVPGPERSDPLDPLRDQLRLWTRRISGGMPSGIGFNRLHAMAPRVSVVSITTLDRLLPSFENKGDKNATSLPRSETSLSGP
jgi:hypothetical protein